MTNALFGIAHSANDTCQYYVASLRFEKTIALYRWFTIWSMTNSRKRINVFLRYFFESSEVRAYSVARIILDNEKDWCTVRAVSGSDTILCQHVSNLIHKYCDFSRCKSMGSKLRWQRIIFANFVLHQLFLPKCVVVLAKTSLNARSSAVLSSACWLLSVVAKEQIWSTSSMLGRSRYFLLEFQRDFFPLFQSKSSPGFASISQRCTRLGISCL